MKELRRLLCVAIILNSTHANALDSNREASTVPHSKGSMSALRNRKSKQKLLKGQKSIKERNGQHLPSYHSSLNNGEGQWGKKKQRKLQVDLDLDLISDLNPFEKDPPPKHPKKGEEEVEEGFFTMENIVDKTLDLPFDATSFGAGALPEGAAQSATADSTGVTLAPGTGVAIAKAVGSSLIGGVLCNTVRNCVEQKVEVVSTSPSISMLPSDQPSLLPSDVPSLQPSTTLSTLPSSTPSDMPSLMPTTSSIPSFRPSNARKNRGGGGGGK